MSLGDLIALRLYRRVMRRSRFPKRTPVVDFEDRFGFYRMTPFWSDEYYQVSAAKLWNRMPWYRPFNILLHWWRPRHDREDFHDHPRWSITVCLRGGLTEITPWGERKLRPGSVVIRSHKAIHAFYVEPQHRGHTWTLFIVGRRAHRQNFYKIKDYYAKP